LLFAVYWLLLNVCCLFYSLVPSLSPLFSPISPIFASRSVITPSMVTYQATEPAHLRPEETHMRIGQYLTQ
jgi:hypothetical protein